MACQHIVLGVPRRDHLRGPVLQTDSGCDARFRGSGDTRQQLTAPSWRSACHVSRSELIERLLARSARTACVEHRCGGREQPLRTTVVGELESCTVEVSRFSSSKVMHHARRGTFARSIRHGRHGVQHRAPVALPACALPLDSVAQRRLQDPHARNACETSRSATRVAPHGHP